MRSQMEELKAKLDRKVKIDEGNIRKLQKRNMGFINKFLVFEWISLVVVSLMFIGAKYFFELSWPLILTMILGLGVDVYLDTYFNRMKNVDIESMTMVEMSEKLLRMKRMRRRQFVIGLPLVTLWVIWLCIELYLGIDTSAASLYRGMIEGSIVGTAVGAIGGGVLVYMTYRKIQNDSDSVLEQINSLKE